MAIFGSMMTGLRKVASKAFELGILEIPEIDLDRIRGLKPRMAEMTEVPYWINPRGGLTTTGNSKTKGVKPSMPGMVCPFFEASTLESISYSIISLITTKVIGASALIPRGTLQRCS